MQIVIVKNFMQSFEKNTKCSMNTLLDEYLEMKQDGVGHCLKVNCNCYGSKDI
jgi:hypothetical protein